jgi:hypothetical protein
MVDVEADPEAARRMEELNPRGTIPTFDMGNGVVMVGFTPKGYEQKLDEAARRKSGN